MGQLEVDTNPKAHDINISNYDVAQIRTLNFHSNVESFNGTPFVNLVCLPNHINDIRNNIRMLSENYKPHDL